MLLKFLEKRYEKKFEKEISSFKDDDFDKGNLERNLVSMSSVSLTYYLTLHFPRNGQDYDLHNKKVGVIKSLNSDDISNAIARMDRINHVNDQKRFFFFIGGLFTIIAAVTGSIVSNIDFGSTSSFKEVVASIGLVYSVPIVIHLLFHWDVLIDSYNKATVNYFKDLLIQARDEKN
ncbi:hypothetical protein [Bacillus altitudinis]|uniref:hypothetical protein n=1 Tax=Bacillus altitudinis TaxID=293387 RepID=UPI0037C713F6